MIENRDIVGGVFLPKDGQTNPIDTTQALARAARMGGVQICEGVKVTEIVTEKMAVTQVLTNRGTVKCDVLVNCAGMWAREVGQMCGVSVPLPAAEHFYVVTEPIAVLPTNLPRAFRRSTKWVRKMLTDSCLPPHLDLCPLQTTLHSNGGSSRATSGKIRGR